jgi:hypothetical protein
MNRREEALDLRREMYTRAVSLDLPAETIYLYVVNLSASLVNTERFDEATSFLREQLPKARRALGAEDDTVLQLCWHYTSSICEADGATRDDVVESMKLHEDLGRTTLRIYAPAHPPAKNVQGTLKYARAKLAVFDTPV